MKYGTKNKLIVFLFAAFLFSSLNFYSIDTEAQNLENPDACSSTMMDMMEMMVFPYLNMSWMCMGMCDQMLGEFFSQVLNDPQLTLEFMDCAAQNTMLIDLMIQITDANPELLYKMGIIAGISCEFAEKFTVLAKRHDGMKNFLFAKLDDHLYKNITISLLCEPSDVVENLGDLFRTDAKYQLIPGTNFFYVVTNLGSTNSNIDANELASERMYYTFFKNIYGSNAMLDGLDSLSTENKNGFLDFIFLGKRLTGYNRSEIHEKQRFYNNYAIMLAMVDGLFHSYNIELPPDPNSSNPSNALVGRILGLFVKYDNNGNLEGLTQYAESFFQSVRSAAEIHCSYEAMDFIQFLAYIFPLDMFDLMPPSDPNAPKLRNFKNDTGNEIENDCPEPGCSFFMPELCLDEQSCEAVHLTWCYNQCLRVENCPDLSCNEGNHAVCQSEAECLSAGFNWCETCYNDGFFWCENYCTNEPCDDVDENSDDNNGHNNNDDNGENNNLVNNYENNDENNSSNGTGNTNNNNSNNNNNLNPYNNDSNSINNYNTDEQNRGLESRPEGGCLCSCTISKCIPKIPLLSLLLFISISLYIVSRREFKNK